MATVLKASRQRVIAGRARIICSATTWVPDSSRGDDNLPTF